jgi:hemoglobin
MQRVALERNQKEKSMKKDARYRMTRFAMVAVMFVFGWAALTGCSHQQAAPMPPTLYERVGGINNIAVLVDDVIERSYADAVFAANPKIHAAHERFPKAVYKFNATALACQVMGGPQVYTGRSLKEAHRHLNVTEEEWQALIRIFRESMSGFKVAAKEQNEIIAIIESTKDEVVATATK